MRFGQLVCFVAQRAAGASADAAWDADDQAFLEAARYPVNPPRLPDATRKDIYGTTETRRDVLEALESVARYYPALRFGQVVTLTAFLARRPGVSAVYDVDDEEFLQALRQQLSRLQAKADGGSAT